jgi:predicted small integral membrane protein
MCAGITKRGQELARRANKAEARVLDRNKFYARVLVWLYFVHSCEWAVLIFVSGGGWFAMLGPVIALFGPRYWKNLREKVQFHTFFAVFLAVAVIFVWLKSPKAPGEKYKPNQRSEPAAPRRK